MKYSVYAKKILLEGIGDVASNEIKTRMPQVGAGYRKLKGTFNRMTGRGRTPSVFGGIFGGSTGNV
jgi:hypothetical protein